MTITEKIRERRAIKRAEQEIKSFLGMCFWALLVVAFFWLYIAFATAILSA